MYQLRSLLATVVLSTRFDSKLSSGWKVQWKIWKALSDEIDFDCDLDASLTAACIAENHFSSTFFQTLQSMHETRYEQWGQMNGSVTMENGQETVLALRGMRDHCYGNRDWNKYRRYIALMGYAQNGTYFHVGLVSINSGIKQFKYGYVGTDSVDVDSITSSSMQFDQLGQDGYPPKSFALAFTAGGKPYQVLVQIRCEVQVFNGFSWQSKSFLTFFDFDINGSTGTGFGEFEFHQRPKDIVDNLQLRQPLVRSVDIGELGAGDKNQLVVPLTHHICFCEDLVGGKARQLAQLMELQNDFSVPPGLVITTAAFDSFVQRSPSLMEALKILEQNRFDPSKVVMIEESFLGADMPTDISDLIRKQLDRLFSADWKHRKFAVRSSACGEDGAISSSAGQMETYLNISGLDEIASSVVKCWASAFTEQAIQYRRQNSVGLLSRIGVIVQEMVPAAVAGIMFTCDPITANPATTVINATKGLGEALAGGTVEPDTIVMKRTYEKPDEFSMDMKASTNAQTCCLWEGQISFLCRVGRQIESAFNSPRDIEWAFDGNGHLFVLQSRPVTGVNQETLTELEHEFDSAILSHNEYSTTHNVGEVMPGSFTPLGISVALNAIDKAIQFQMSENNVMTKMHASMELVFAVYCSKILLRLSQAVYRDRGAMKARNVSDMCIMGSSYEDENLDNILKEKFKGGSEIVENVTGLCRAIRMLYVGSKRKRRLSKLISDLPDNPHLDMPAHPKAILAKIESYFGDYCEAWLAHSAISGVSGIYYHFLFAILTADLKDNKWNDVTLEDIATICSSCNQVESADIPKSIESIARRVLHEDKYSRLADESSEQWLLWFNTEAEGRSALMFREFMNRHGHRCISEIDLMEKTWSEDPMKLVDCIKATCKRLQTTAAKSVVSPPTTDEIIARLKTPLDKGKLWFMKFLLPKAKQAVSDREHTKSSAIRMTLQIRLLYRKLSQVLVDQNIMPSAQLLYYLTHSELKQLVADTEIRATLVHRARKRLAIRSQLEQIQLPEMCIGYPKPIQHQQDHYKLGTNFVVGTVVSPGVTVGHACVCRTLSDATSLQAGDILIAYSTDIAWSLYFPILSGVVTELGGLLSHGAVVAREYGLPCLVSAKGAVNVFNTGDLCRLDSSAGKITKIIEE